MQLLAKVPRCEEKIKKDQIVKDKLTFTCILIFLGMKLVWEYVKGSTVEETTWWWKSTWTTKLRTINQTHRVSHKAAESSTAS